ncbi:F-box/kelch-repeat protein SKIP20-like [Juglans regia]|uniref:F-box/kelch-repeat protein SKIP20-like n=1 Tax=Juglans regia TaxID=51240 RepID=A0A2I4DXB7_JUGRE|nr:F-box/kelch-repeat protein SKIP20-like [Juglans regia]
MGQTESSTENFQKQQQQQQHPQKQLIPGLPDEIAMECLVRVPHQFHPTMKLVCQSWRFLIMNPSFYQERRRSGMAEHIVCLVQPVPCSPPSITESSDSDMTELSNRNTTINEEEVDAKSSTARLIQYGLSIYNATHQTWHRMMMRPGGGHVRIPMFCQCVALPAPGKLLLLGGWDPDTLEPVPDVYVLDLIGGVRWGRAAPMSVARSFFACGVVGQSMVYVAGGHDNQKNAMRSAEVYDADADEWRTLPPMADERDECQGLSWEGDYRFWVVSGYSTDSQGRFRSDAECFDPVTGSWSRIEGVWPYPSVSPRGLTTTVTIADKSDNGSHHNQNQYQWWWFLGSPQQHQDNGGVKELDNSKNIIWKAVDHVQLPGGINGTTSLCVNTLGLGPDQYFANTHNQQPQRVFLMSSGGGGGRGTSSSSVTCGECECAGEGTYIFSTKWNHVHTPPAFSGFPYSASCLMV